MLRYLAAILLCCSGASAMTPLEAVKIAAPHREGVDQELWYAWFPELGPSERSALVQSLNYGSRSSRDVFVGEVGGLLFFDLDDLADTEEDLNAIRYQFLLMARDDTRFHEPHVRLDLPGRGPTTFSPPSRLLGEYGLRLQSASSPTIPILDGRRIVASILASAEVQGISPRYYGVRGLEPGKTKLEEYLRSRGSSLEKVRELLSLEQSLLNQSNVTGKERVVMAWRGQGVRPSVGTGLVSMTMDMLDENVADSKKSFVRNLLIEEADGYELILEKSSGWHEFTIWDGTETLVAEAPPNLVTDRLVPNPHTTRLQGAISCIRCHGGEEGWKEFESWFPEDENFGIAGDSTGDFDPDNYDRISSLYGGDLLPVLAAGRDTLATRIFTVTRNDDPASASAAVAGVYNEYVYGKIKEDSVFSETGAESWEDFHPIPDPKVNALKRGIPMSRADFEVLWPAIYGSKK